jgi:hypothetical protein
MQKAAYAKLLAWQARIEVNIRSVHYYDALRRSNIADNQAIVNIVSVQGDNTKTSKIACWISAACVKTEKCLQQFLPMAVQVQVRVRCNLGSIVGCIREERHKVVANLAAIGVQREALPDAINQAIIITSWIAIANIVDCAIHHDAAQSMPAPGDLSHMWNAPLCACLGVK